MVRPPLVRPYPSRSRGLQPNQLHAIPLLRSQAVSVTPTCTISCPPQPLGPRWAKATTANAAPMTRPRLYAYCRTSVRRRLALMWRARTRTAHGARSSKAQHARRTTWRTTGCSPHPISMWCIGASFSLTARARSIHCPWRAAGTRRNRSGRLRRRLDCLSWKSTHTRRTSPWKQIEPSSAVSKAEPKAIYFAGCHFTSRAAAAPLVWQPITTAAS